ncbi:DUF6529 family protein [Streptomyces sp. ME03-5709C]|nr:DUF6529 family protein [Streptomyces sp. ME03-5709C]
MGHALPGCFVFGAFTAKMLLLRAERLPDRLPSVVGGPVVPATVVPRPTSAFVFFPTVGVTT